MGLVDQIFSAINNPNQQASSGQMDNILGTVAQLSSQTGADPATMQSAVSIVGNYVRSALQQKQANAGFEEAQSIVNQFSGTQPNRQAVNSLFSPSQIEGMVEVVEQRTGLNASLVKQMLPILVPVVLNFLQSGSHNQNPQGSNPVLNAFLDADQDGDLDIADAMQLAGRYLRP